MARWLLFALLAVGLSASQNPCLPNPCGANADCIPVADLNGDLYGHCECRIGFSGNAWIGCEREGDTHCCGDPHCRTLDGSYYDYQGTCPYIFSTPCKKFNNETLDYVVKGLNREMTKGSPVAYVSEMEVEMYGFKLHVTPDLKLTVNGVKTGFPFYWPQKNRSKLLAEIRGGMVFIRNEFGVVVQFYKDHLKMRIPYYDEYVGDNIICGFSGNMNNDCSDDVHSKDLVHISQKPCVHPVNKKNMAKLSKLLDTWITDEFTGFTATDKCRTGSSLAPELPTCTNPQSAKDCIAILDAGKGKGVFAGCKGLGADFLKLSYEACVFDTCFDESTRCRNLKNFAVQCQNAPIGKVDLKDWRTKVGCPISCEKQLPNSIYSSCVSGCQATCDNPKLTVKDADCPLQCTEGCRCKDGFLLDTSSVPHKCVVANDCPCYDDTGSVKPNKGSWLSENCTKKSLCSKKAGKKVVTVEHKCQEHSSCGVNDEGYLTCKCEAVWKQKDENTCVKA